MEKIETHAHMGSQPNSVNSKCSRIVSVLRAAHAKFDAIENNIRPQRPQEATTGEVQTEDALVHSQLDSAENLASDLDRRIAEVADAIG